MPDTTNYLSFIKHDVATVARIVCRDLFPKETYDIQNVIDCNERIADFMRIAKS